MKPIQSQTVYESKVKTLRWRLAFYRYMLRAWMEGDPGLTQNGFCGTIADSHVTFHVHSELRDFPELRSQKPKKLYAGPRNPYRLSFWWAPGSQAPRVRALLRAIRLAERKLTWINKKKGKR